MQEFINVLITYWKPITGLLFTIIGFILLCIQKKPVSDVDSVIFKYALLAVSAAEQTNLKGVEKLAYAVNYVIEKLKGVFPQLPFEKYVDYISKVIEAILSTPQKKG